MTVKQKLEGSMFKAVPLLFADVGIMGTLGGILGGIKSRRTPRDVTK
jgi:hypothetical protein